MSCNKECPQQPTCPETNCGRGNGYLCIVVLYILLVIILGSFIIC